MRRTSRGRHALCESCVPVHELATCVYFRHVEYQPGLRLSAAHDAGTTEWDRALAGHSAAERAAAEVYTLDV